LIRRLAGWSESGGKCWRTGYFFEEEVRNGYDVRRPVTDAIIESIEINNGTILFGATNTYFKNIRQKTAKL
jgi:hypothetical protein